jgi:hypothetical protein
MGIGREVPMTQDDIQHVRFSDEEFAFLRHIRFGELPPRIPPSQRVELTETEHRRDQPEPWSEPGTRYAGG